MDLSQGDCGPFTRASSKRGQDEAKPDPFFVCWKSCMEWQTFSKYESMLKK
jgi:hypothetical protein